MSNLASLAQQGKFISFDWAVGDYQLLGILEEIFEGGLEDIHLRWDTNFGDLTVFNDQLTDLHARYYSRQEDAFLNEYYRFVVNVLEPLFDEPILLQARPTFRIHVPGNLAVAEFHKDEDYGHSPKEINFFLPFTDATDTCTIWYLNGDGQHIPLNTPLGQFWVWSGSTIPHGNKSNMTNKCRVSIDFRVLLESDYDPSNAGQSVTMRKNMVIGDYWVRLSDLKT